LKVKNPLTLTLENLLIIPVIRRFSRVNQLSGFFTFNNDEYDEDNEKNNQKEPKWID
jgi:hypothetical protein